MHDYIDDPPAPCTTPRDIRESPGGDDGCGSCASSRHTLTRMEARVPSTATSKVLHMPPSEPQAALKARATALCARVLTSRPDPGTTTAPLGRHSRVGYRGVV
jgi:hypothetical protein